MKHPIPSKLLDTIGKLETDSYHAITVVNRITAGVILCNATGEKIKEEHGGILAFLESLNQQGIKAIRICSRRKNGSNFRNAGEDYDLDFGTDGQSIDPNFPATQPLLESGLNGIMPQGMNAVQLYNSMDYDRVKREADRLQILVDSQKETIDRLKEEAIKTEFSRAKATSNNELLLGIIPHLAPIIATKLAPAQAATQMASEVIGMSGAAPSPQKQQAIMFVNALSDDEAYDLSLIMHQLLNKNEAVGQDLVAIIAKYDLEKEPAA